MNYRGHQIIYHEDGGWIVIYKKVVVFAAPTLKEAKAWIAQRAVASKTPAA